MKVIHFDSSVLWDKLFQFIDIYKKAFYEELKEQASEAWLSPIQWQEISENFTLRQWYTDFYNDLFAELFRRVNAKYMYFDDLLTPNIKDLKSQITVPVIQDVLIQSIAREKIVYEHFYTILSDLDFSTLYQKYLDNTIWTYLKGLTPFWLLQENVELPIPEERLREYYEKLFPNYGSDDWKLLPMDDFLKDVYNNALQRAWIDFLTSVYEILGDSEKLKNAFHNQTDFLKEYICMTWDDLIDEDCDYIEDRVMLHIFFNYPILLDESDNIREIWMSYLKKKIMMYYYQDKSPSFEKNTEINFSGNEVEIINHQYFSENEDDINISNKEAFLSKELIKSFIEIFQKESIEYRILRYCYNTWIEHDESEYSRIIDMLICSYDTIVLDDSLRNNPLEKLLHSVETNIPPIDKPWLKARFLLKSKISKIIEKEWDKYIDSLKDYFDWESQLINKMIWEHNTRWWYKIGMVFGDETSKKAFELYCNNEKNLSTFKKNNLKLKQFTTYIQEYDDNFMENMSKKLREDIVTFILIFDWKITNKVKAFCDNNAWKVFICNKIPNHFSKESFEEMLEIAIKNYEDIILEDEDKKNRWKIFNLLENV